jgi:hypothetical protein
MNIELTLLELNQLYYATSKLVEQNESHLKELGRNVSSINYFKDELNKSILLRDKIQTALYDEAKRLDEAIEFVRNYKASNDDGPEYDSAGFTENDRDYSAFKDYADSMNDAQSEDRRLGNI